MKSLGDLDQKKCLKSWYQHCTGSSDILYMQRQKENSLKSGVFLCTKVIKYDMPNIDPKLKNSLQP